VATLTQVKELSHCIVLYELKCLLKGFAIMDGSHLRKLPTAIAGVALMFPTFATGATAQTVPPDLPLAIFCFAQPDQSWRIGYLYRVNKNGDAMYITPNGKLGTTINAKGVVMGPANRPAGADCYGKTLEELRSSGRVMEFQRTK
jgi:hypothetical protein